MKSVLLVGSSRSVYTAAAALQAKGVPPGVTLVALLPV
jgi:hypothetical protein